MAEFQKVYVEKTIEIPLYFRKDVYLVSPKLGNFFGNPTSGRARRGTPSTGASPSRLVRA